MSFQFTCKLALSSVSFVSSTSLVTRFLCYNIFSVCLPLSVLLLPATNWRQGIRRGHQEEEAGRPGSRESGSETRFRHICFWGLDLAHLPLFFLFILLLFSPLCTCCFPTSILLLRPFFPPLEITLSTSYVPLQSLLILQDSDEMHLLSNFPKHSIHTDIHVLGIPEASLSAPCTAQSYCSVTAPILQLIVPNSLKVVIYKQKNTSIFLKITVFKYDVSILFFKDFM